MFSQTYQVPKQFTTRLDTNLYEDFTEFADETRIAKSVLVREFIKRGIEQAKQKGISNYLSEVNV